MDPKTNLQHEPVEAILKRCLPVDLHKFTQRLLFGQEDVRELILPEEADGLSEKSGIHLQGYSLVRRYNTDDNIGDETFSKANATRVGLFQNGIQSSTESPIVEQIQKLHEIGRKAVELAGICGVNIFCFQELWIMPMGFCTQKKLPWVEFAEDAEFGSTTTMLKSLARQYNMVIISPILERDEMDFLWNTAVVIDANGEYLGKYRKCHIPLSGKFSESSYYKGSESGIPLFHTKYGKFGLNICYDRHHPQNWFAHNINGAQIVFNPSATVQSFSEPLWPIEARNAAASNGFYVCAINRIGKELFSFDGKQEVGGPFFGSSYISSPDGRRTPGLPIAKDGLLVADLDLQICSKYSPEISALKVTSSGFLDYFK